ncbi:hypothetical protein N7527_006201 [Penicillium freii]|nr:hypothetical protein N7527_006201 [Penicillium freii]
MRTKNNANQRSQLSPSVKCRIVVMDAKVMKRAVSSNSEEWLIFMDILTLYILANEGTAKLLRGIANIYSLGFTTSYRLFPRSSGVECFYSKAIYLQDDR